MGYVTRKDLEAAGVVIPDGSAPWSPPWLVPPPVSKPKASATGPTPEKPRELAAGQVWELTWEAGNVQRFVLTWPHYAINGAWHFEGGEGGIYVTSETILGGRRIRYLGTKEEVAAREKRETPSGSAIFEPLTGEALDEMAIGYFGTRREDGETDESLRARCLAISRSPGERTPMPRPGSVTIGQNITAGIAAGLSRKAKPDPYPNAALHRAIDDAIAADFGPFAHARAAALRAWSETDAPAWVTATPREMLVMLRVTRTSAADNVRRQRPRSGARRRPRAGSERT